MEGEAAFTKVPELQGGVVSVLISPLKQHPQVCLLQGFFSLNLPGIEEKER